MRWPLSVVGVALLLTGCATQAGLRPGSPGGEQARYDADPLEPLNRKLFGAGRVVDKALARPAATAYRRITPGPVRRGVRNALQNADEPVVVLNDLLQGRPTAGARALVRFAANSTVGLAGLFDPAAKAGLPHHDNGFASTLSRYGVPAGPYLFLPLVGPLSLRDAIGGGVDYATDPLSLARFRGAGTVNVARTSLSLLDERAQAERNVRTLFASAADPYATARSVYLQTERAQAAGSEPALEDLPDLPSLPSQDLPAPPGPPGDAGAATPPPP